MKKVVQKFKSGAVRDRQKGKGRFDLMSPFALKAYADVCEEGSLKFGGRNFEKGMPLSRFIDSALRHIGQVVMGLDNEDHMGHALWNVASYIHTKKLIEMGLLPKELDDMPNYVHRTADSWKEFLK